MAAPIVLDRRRLYVVFGGLMLAMSLGALDQAIVATALPTIVADLGGLEHLSWIVTAYLLSATASTPLWGKLGDLYGRKRVFIATITTFLVGSALCGLSHTMGQLIAARFLQGLGGGGLIVTTQATVGDIVSPRERGRYQGVFGAVFALMSVVGPLLGGFFVDDFTWHWVFYVNLPIGIAALAVTTVALPELQKRSHHVVDYGGAILSAAATVCFVLPMTLGGVEFAWASPQTAGLVAAGLVLTWVFVRLEGRAAEPLLPLNLFRNSVFSVSSALAFVVGGAMLGPVTILPLFMQMVNGVTPTQSGLRLLPLLLAVPAASITSGQLISRWGKYRVFPITGTALMAAGLFLLSRLDAQTSTFASSVYMLVLGLGLGMVMQVLVLAVQNSVEFRDLGSATSGVTFFRAMGSVFGVALFGGIFASRLTTHLAAGVLPGAFNPAQLEVQPAATAALPEAVRATLVGAYSLALHPVFLVAAPFAVAAFVLSWRLEEIPLRETVSATHTESPITPGADVTSAAEVERVLSELMTREGRRAIYERLAARAGIQLSPVGCWLLFRIGEFKPRSVGDLAGALSVDPVALRGRLARLEDQGLLVMENTETGTDQLIGITALGHDMLDRLVRARCEGLQRLVTTWVPERHAELDELLRRLARVMVPDLQAEA